jgi:hypothetical protein
VIARRARRFLLVNSPPPVTARFSPDGRFRSVRAPPFRPRYAGGSGGARRRRARRPHPAAQPRRRAIGARRHPAAQRHVQPRRRGHRRRRLLPRRPPPHLRRDGRAQRARRRHRLHHGEGGADAHRRDRGRRRRRLHRPPRRRRAEGDQRRALRLDRQGEVDAAVADRRPAREPGGGLRRRRGRRRDPRWRREARLRGRRQANPQRLHPDRRSRPGELRHPQQAAAAPRPRVGRADRLHRARRDDRRPAAGRPGHRRGPAVDGQDQLRAEHRAARRAQSRTTDDGRLLQPGDVGAAAVHPPAHRRGPHRRPAATSRPTTTASS